MSAANVAAIFVLVIVLVVRDRENSNEILKLKSAQLAIQRECRSHLNHRAKRDIEPQDEEAVLLLIRKEIDNLLLDKINLLLPDVIKSLPASSLCRFENNTQTAVNVTHISVNNMENEERKLIKCEKGERGLKGDNGLRGQKGERGFGLFEPQERVNDLNKTAYIADNKTLLCSFFGNPVPSVEWTVNGVNYDIKTKVIDTSSEVFSYLVVSNITFQNHGNVSCSAKTILGQVIKTGFIDVHVKPKVSFSSTIFYVDLASNVTFPTCNVFSNPAANITWKKGFGEIPKSRSIQSIFGNLIMTDVQVEDDGFYVCTAENYLGSDSGVVQLKTKPLKISHGSQSESVFFNYPQILWCGAYGRTEKISAKWRSLTTNQIIDHSELKTKNFYNSTIAISESGTFSCEFTDGVIVVQRSFVVKSFILPSKILKTPDEYKKIYELLKEVNAPTNIISRCMQMSENSDYEASSVWTNFQPCYYIKNTLVVAKVKNENWILGGFTDVQWNNIESLSNNKTFVFTTYPNFKIKNKDLSKKQPCLMTTSGRSYPCFGVNEFTFEEEGERVYSNIYYQHEYTTRFKALIKSNILLGSEKAVNIQDMEVFYLM